MWLGLLTGCPALYYLPLGVHHRAANVPYFSGSGGVTPPGGNTFGRTWFNGLLQRCATMWVTGEYLVPGSSQE